MQPLNGSYDIMWSTVTMDNGVLVAIGGGWNLPSGAYAQRDGDGVVLEAMLASLDGRVVLRVSGSDDDPVRLGRELARRLLDENGGRALLEEVA